MRGIVRGVLAGVLLSAMVLAGLFFLEGFCSFIVAARSLHAPIAERLHTRYDPVLGWSNLPNFYAKDMYGDGVAFRTNAQGFRNDRDFSVAVPDGKTRIICSGDSFTLGYGVDNDHNWCQELVALDPSLETVNMGQGGYGIDQAYLWYRKDGQQLDHQLQLFGVMGDDFSRFGASFLGYAKPFFALRNGDLLLCNTPVPRQAYWWPWLTENLPVIRQLKLVSVLAQRQPDGWQRQQKKEKDPSLAREITLRIFEKLNQSNQRKGSRLVVVYLPCLGDLEDGNYREWREFLATELSRQGILFFDLMADFEDLSPEDQRALFLTEEKFFAGKGHYSPEGNHLVADSIYQRLQANNLIHRK